MANRRTRLAKVLVAGKFHWLEVDGRKLLFYNDHGVCCTCMACVMRRSSQS